MFKSTKLDPEAKRLDVCLTSIEILKRACEGYLGKLGIRPCFADHHDFYRTLESRNGEVVDVVLFGSYLERFIESGTWPKSRYRFWVLTSCVRDVLTRQLGIPSSAIQVIPRYSLFATTTGRPLPDFRREPTALVFAGRISAVKNIEFLLRTISALQEYGCPVTLSLFGDPDDQYHYDLGRRTHRNFHMHIEEVLRTLPWKTRPIIRRKMGSDEWLASAPADSVLVSLSSFLKEDFDVSLAQAQAAGWPAIVSDWGGHRSAAGENIMKIPRHMIADSHAPARIQELKSKALAAYLMTKAGTPGEKITGAPQEEVALPEPTSFCELDDIRRNFFAGIGPDAHLIYRDSIEAFADTSAGRKFFRHSRALYGSSLFTAASRPAIVVVNDLHDSSMPELQGIRELCTDAIEVARTASGTVAFIPLEDVKEGQIALDLLDAEKIVFPFAQQQILPFLDSLLRTAPRASIRVIYRANQDRSCVQAIKARLRPGDRLLEFDGCDANRDSVLSGALL